MGRVRAYVGLGANVGDAAGTLAATVHALAALPGVRLVGVSRLYATAPVGVTDQPEFRNAVVALDVPAGPDPPVGALALLVALKGLERAFGRRDGPRWGPRALDLDLLVFGHHTIRVERPPEARRGDPALAVDPAGAGDPARVVAQWLIVPHPSARERLFVLAPLAELAPGLRPPGWGETVAAARDRAELHEGPAAVRPIACWGRDAGAWEPLDTDGVARDGSPVAVYLELPGDEDAALIDRALLEAGLPPGCEILELGCGAGRVTAPLSALGHRVIAVDQSAMMIDEVHRRLPDATAIVGDIQGLDLGRRVPAVLLGSHLVNDGATRVAAFLETCRRHVASSGAVLIQAYDTEMDWGAAAGRRTIAGTVAITLVRADRNGDRLRGSVVYETRSGRWVQDFAARLLDEEDLRAALDLAGLRFERWIDRPAGWLLARPA